MQNPIADTIAGRATPAGAGGIGIIRISGSGALDVLNAVFKPRGKNIQASENAEGLKNPPRDILNKAHGAKEFYPPRKLVLGRVCQKDGSVIDEALAVFFPAPNSYTGEDMAELQCHGGALVLKKVLGEVLAAGARLAQPGEFTLRAFLNGKLDLTRAEAVMDIVSAKTQTALDMAEDQLQGSLYSALQPIEDEILNLLSRLAAAADFPEEVDSLTEEELLPLLKELKEKIEKLLSGADAGRIYREGLSVVLLGPANAGKSSLLNALLKEERAIVTASAGTTRDVIEEYLNLDGLAILLSDTAGLRKAEDEAESIGISKSKAKAKTAQLLLLVIDASSQPDEEIISLLREYANYKLMLILNKTDLASPAPWEAALKELAPKIPAVAISAKTGEGLPHLKQAILDYVLQGEAHIPSLINNLRHQEALLLAERHLSQAIETLENGLTLDLATIDIDLAWQALGEITGKTAGEDVINRIFENFCLGK